MPTVISNRNINKLEDESNKAKKELSHFFSPVDRGSSMPSWYYDRKVREEKEWIEKHERQVKDNLIPEDDILKVKSEMKVRKEKLSEIEESYENAKKQFQEQKDFWAKEYDRLGKIIGDSMPHIDHMFNIENGRKMRLISAQDEALRVKHRNNPVKLWKILGHFLGESTNPETLRPHK